MAKDKNQNEIQFTEQGETVVYFTKALFANDMQRVFAVIETHMVENDLRISEEIISEFRSKGLIQP